jgi:imidazole glycerol-phosphate synthase subunit HisF
VGADKVAVNTAAVETPALIGHIAHRFGSQCVVVSIDFRRRDGGAEVYTRAGTKPTGMDPVEWAREVEERGAGEILLTSIERDGAMCGYDMEMTRRVSEAVSIPVIASGGASSYEDMREVIEKAKVPAVAAAAIFHFTQQTPLEAKQYLRAHGMAVRS